MGSAARFPASMRPRHYTAENRQSRSSVRIRCISFNEAAALHRGKRPPKRAGRSATTPSFNEAAALHRGKPSRGDTASFMMSLLQ